MLGYCNLHIHTHAWAMNFFMLMHLVIHDWALKLSCFAIKSVMLVFGSIHAYASNISCLCINTFLFIKFIGRWIFHTHTDIIVCIWTFNTQYCSCICIKEKLVQVYALKNLHFCINSLKTKIHWKHFHYIQWERHPSLQKAYEFVMCKKIP
jgi:hypothetical protein